jgi:hypothetical protein
VLSKYKILVVLFCLSLILNIVFTILPDGAFDEYPPLRILGILDLPGAVVYIFLSGDIHGI